MRDSIARALGLLTLVAVLWFAAWLYRTTLTRETAPTARGASVPLTVADGRLIVEVTVDLPGELRFIVDTGAERSAIGVRATRRIEAPLVGRTRLLGPGGQRDAPLASLDPLHIGDLTVRRVPAVVVESALLGDYDGILGLDVLRLFDLRIDVPAGRLALLPVRHTFEDDQGVALRDVRAGIVAIDVIIDGVPATAIIDTGLPRTLLNSAAAAALGLVTGDEGVRRGLDGTPIHTSSATLSRLTAGAATLLADATVDIADAPLFAATGLADRPALLLGADAFLECGVRIAWTARRFVACGG